MVSPLWQTLRLPWSANAVPIAIVSIITTATSSTEMRLIVIVSSSPFFFWARAQASGFLLRLVPSYSAGAGS
jgi:hypothetical protein